ncbi:hypothetical protein ACFLZ7_01745 [Nanoarchaeota archaeon]
MNGEAPLYVLKPDKARIVIPNGLKLILLAIVFYVGVLINIKLLSLNIPDYINLLIIIVLVILVLLESILSFVRLSKIQYLFYPNRLEVKGTKQQYVMFTNVPVVKFDQNFFDKLFDTGSVTFGAYKMKAIPNVQQNVDYLEKLIQSSRTQYVAR